MRWVKAAGILAAATSLTFAFSERSEAQVRYPGAGYPGPAYYGAPINNCQFVPGYPAAYGRGRGSFAPAAPLTVTNYQPLVSAITSIPGWYGPAHHSRRPSRGGRGRR